MPKSHNNATNWQKCTCLKSIASQGGHINQILGGQIDYTQKAIASCKVGIVLTN